MEGRKCKGYLNTGTYSSPTWSELKRITGVKLPSSRGTGQVKFRGSQKVKASAGYLEESVSFQYKCKRPGLTDSVLTALLAAYRAGTIIDCAFMDQAIATSGAKGVRGPFIVSKCDRNEDDEDAVTYDVELKEADDEQSGTPFELDAYTTT